MPLRSSILCLSLMLASCGPQPEPTPKEHKDAISDAAGKLCMAASVSCTMEWRGPRRRERLGVIPIETPNGPMITMQHVRAALSPDVWTETPGEREGEFVFRRGPYRVRYLGTSIRIEWLGPA